MPKKFITIEDIRNPKRKSGFNYVSQNGGAYSKRTVSWRAEKGTKKGSTPFEFRGPSRLTPEEAAQDYCDFINGRSLSSPVTLKSAGHSYDNIYAHSKDSEEEAALGVLRDKQAQRAGRQGYVYCIAHLANIKADSGGFDYVKIGYSVNPKKRVAELQTGNPYTLKLLGLKKGTEEDEKALQQKYIQHNVLQEWFVATKEMLLEFDLNPDGKPWAEAKKEAASA